MAGMAGTPHRAHHALLLDGVALSAVAMWSLMVVAMMLPTALPAVRHVAANSLRRRRPGAMLTFAAAFVLIWVAFGVVLLLAAPAWSALDRTAVGAGALALPAGWQLTGTSAVRWPSHRPSPLPPTGRRPPWASSASPFATAPRASAPVGR